LKSECIRPECPLCLQEAIKVVENFVNYYNTEHLHSAVGYIVHIDKLEGREKEIFDARDHKLEAARKARKQRRQKSRAVYFEKLVSTI